MVAEIRQRLKAEKFKPFRIRLVNGRELRVRTAAHAWVPPRQERVLVEEDGCAVDIVQASQIVEILPDLVTYTVVP